MTQSPRPCIPGKTYFLTARLQDPRSDLLIRHIEPLRKATRAMCQTYPTHIDAMVVLPNMLHALWTLHDADPNLPAQWMLLAKRFSDTLPRKPTDQNRERARQVWRTDVWHHSVAGSSAIETYCAMIHDAPVEQGLVTHADAWPFSSIHRQTCMETIRPGAQSATPRASVSG